MRIFRQSDGKEHAIEMCFPRRLSQWRYRKNQVVLDLSLTLLCSMSTVLSILLWPLVVYHELIQRMYTRLEPVLMKLDYSMKAETLHHKHEKKSKEPPSLAFFGAVFLGWSCSRTIGDHVCQYCVVTGCRGAGVET